MPLFQHDHPRVVEAVLASIKPCKHAGDFVGVNAFADQLAQKYLAEGADSGSKHRSTGSKKAMALLRAFAQEASTGVEDRDGNAYRLGQLIQLPGTSSKKT